MLIDDLHYDLPSERIAQHPAERRDASRLLVLDRATGWRRHETFARLPELLPPGALLVLNDTRVLPARLSLRRRTGGRVEGLFLHEPEPCTWELMLTESRRLRPGELLTVEPGPQQLELTARQGPGIWRAEPVPPGAAHAILVRYGRPPLPPYIKRPRGEGDGTAGWVDGGTEGRRGTGTRGHGDGGTRGRGDTGTRGQGDKETRGHGEGVAHLFRGGGREEDAERYQTIYARHAGAVAAPTAGLHFTAEVFAALAAAGMSTAFVTLHVGAGTFAPIRCQDLADHPMHAEWYDCPESSAAAVQAARQQGRKIVAVGTTSVRVLETAADPTGAVCAGSGWTRLFIYPPYRFKAVDAMVTNFHLPGSTLLAMIFAFAGRETVLAVYEEAVRLEYRFYSFGDTMLIL